MCGQTTLLSQPGSQGWLSGCQDSGTAARLCALDLAIQDVLGRESSWGFSSESWEGEVRRPEGDGGEGQSLCPRVNTTESELQRSLFV